MHVENTGSDEDDGKEFDRGKFFPKEKYGEEHTENDGCFTQGRDHRYGGLGHGPKGYAVGAEAAQAAEKAQTKLDEALQLYSSRMTLMGNVLMT